MLCNVCNTPLKNLFYVNSFFCPNDCDKKVTDTPGEDMVILWGIDQRVPTLDKAFTAGICPDDGTGYWWWYPVKEMALKRASFYGYQTEDVFEVKFMVKDVVTVTPTQVAVKAGSKIIDTSFPSET